MIGLDGRIIAEDNRFCKTMTAVQKKHGFCTEWVPTCPFATQIAANNMSSCPRPGPEKNSEKYKPHVEIDL